jgi:hypothetical protein
LAGKTITGATLKIYHIGGGEGLLSFSAHCLSENWGETTVTWNNQPSYTDNGAVSLELSGQDFKWVYFNILNLIADIINNSRTYYGILLRQPGSDNEFKQFRSREYGGYTPQLTVDYKSGLSAKVSGVWKDTTVYVKVSGVWVEASAYGKVSGVWTE